MIMSSRIVWSDNGTLKDLSVPLNSYVSGSQVIDYVAAQDYIYVGADFPFNHKYFDVGVVNAASSSVSIDIWDGTGWRAAVDVIDQTSVASVPFAQSGIISWRPDQNAGGWVRADTNNSSTITGLSSVKIYGLYWARFSWASDLTGTFALKYVGQKFSDDADLYSIYSGLQGANVLDAFKTGKTDWVEQELVAAEDIVRELKKMNVAVSGAQILEWGVFKLASVHKTAAIIYQSFGKDYFENADRAEKKFQEAIENTIKMIDKTNDARVDLVERVSKDGWLSR